ILQRHPLITFFVLAYSISWLALLALFLGGPLATQFDKEDTPTDPETVVAPAKPKRTRRVGEPKPRTIHHHGGSLGRRIVSSWHGGKRREGVQVRTKQGNQISLRFLLQ